MTEHLPSKSLEPAGETGSVFALLKAAAEESPEILTGLASEVHPLLGTAIKLFHAQSKGSFLRQLAVHLEELRKKGAIKDDYPKSQQARDMMTDLLTYLERENPDSARLDAARKVFLNAATEQLSSREDPLPQQLLQIVMELSAGELLVLSAMSQAKGGQAGPNHGISKFSATVWAQNIAEATGLKHADLVLLHDDKLVKRNLSRPRNKPNDTFQWGVKDRLTELGLEVSRFLAPDSEA